MLFRWLSLLFWCHLVVWQVVLQLNDSCESQIDNGDILFLYRLKHTYKTIS